MFRLLRVTLQGKNCFTVIHIGITMYVLGNNCFTVIHIGITMYSLVRPIIKRRVTLTSIKMWSSVISIHHHTKLEAYRFIKVWTHVTKNFFDAASKTAVISHDYINLTQDYIRMFNLNCFITYPNFISFWSLQATLPLNKSTRSSFLVILWHSVKVEII